MVAVPTTAALPHSLKLPQGDPSVGKPICRLPRAALLTIALDWLDEKNQPLCRPYLADDEDDADGDDDGDDDEAFPPGASVEEVRQIYLDMQQQRGPRREVVDRILYGDWVRGSLLKLIPTMAYCALLLNLDANCYGSNVPATWPEPLSSGDGRPELSVPQMTPRPTLRPNAPGYSN